jgi:hypothetical protein
MAKSISVERIDPLTPSHNENVTFWRVTGTRVRGVVTALIGYPDGEGPQMYVGLDWTATDENGNTEYRAADPDRFEVQSGMSVSIDPLRVNNVPYAGTRYYSVPDGKWRHGGYTYNVTAAGDKVIDEIGRLIAAELGTPENIKSAELRSLWRDVERTRDALDKATADHNAARDAILRAASKADLRRRGYDI